MSSSIARIAWFLPTLSKGSGGLNTIFRNAEHLVESGYSCDFFFPPSSGLVTTEEETRRRLRSWFDYPYESNIYLYETDADDRYDLIIATFWETAPLVAMQKCRNKAYFIQDWEPSFYPVSDAYFLAMQSYELGLTPITIGRWLAAKAGHACGRGAFYTDFCADLSIYSDLHMDREEAICAIYQPEKPRRGSKTLIDALRIVKQLNPGLTIYLYGSSSHCPEADFINLGILSKAECNRLYNRCKVGLSMSSTNPSRIPFEMMAAGLPVVDLAGENTSFDFPGDAICFANASPVSLATQIDSLINDSSRLKLMSDAGVSYMQVRPLSLEREQFKDSCQKILQGVSPSVHSTQRRLQQVLPDGKNETDASRSFFRADLLSARNRCQPKPMSRSCLISFEHKADEVFINLVIAVWSNPDQSDIQWVNLKKIPNSNIWSAEVGLTELSNQPTAYFMHLYSRKNGTDDANMQLVFPFTVSLVLDDDKDHISTIKVSGTRQMNLVLNAVEYEPVMAYAPNLDSSAEEVRQAPTLDKSLLRKMRSFLLSRFQRI